MAAEKARLNLPLDRFESDWKTLEKHYSKIYSAANLILCPSQIVAEGVAEVCPQAESAIEIAPYGCSIEFNNVKRAAQHGRILWAGWEWLRKGLIYLAEATLDLKSKGYDIDVRIAGITDPLVINDNRFRHLNFLGKLDKDSFKQELLLAHMFVLPTLSEGMAGVAIEECLLVVLL